MASFTKAKQNLNLKGNAIVVKKLKGDSREDISITPPYSRDNLIQFQIT